MDLVVAVGIRTATKKFRMVLEVNIDERGNEIKWVVVALDEMLLKRYAGGRASLLETAGVELVIDEIVRQTLVHEEV